MPARPSLIAPLLAASLLAGCASMTEDQCRRADWFERGRIDGRDGQSRRYVEEHRDACAKAAVVPDIARWTAGWESGVREYCTPRVAWREGTSNATYRGACSHLDETTFLRYHRSGRDLWRTRQEITANRNEVDRLEKDLKKAEKDEDRKRLRESVERLDTEWRRLRRLAETLELGAPR